MKITFISEKFKKPLKGKYNKNTIKIIRFTNMLFLKFVYMFVFVLKNISCFGIKNNCKQLKKEMQNILTE